MTKRNGVRDSASFEPIAVIGMRGRFPGASDLDDFWDNLTRGVESISSLTQAEMRASGVPDQIFQMPGYVNAAPLLEGVDLFDAEFFGFSARDASLTDPQHRLFLETTWEALEDAGYDPDEYPGPIGLFGGCELSSYLYHLYMNRESLGYLDGMQLMVTNDKDHLCTQVSYRLDLKGPSVVVQTTCSTSLVAVAMACDSLHSGRSDMALAGGVTVRVPPRGGYLYTPGSILSPDGHCRPFDAEAQGTIVGSGVGVVVLKRLDDAIADRDNVRAVILGAGLNNDGNDKAGYTAPSFRGQAAAIRAAQTSAGVTPDSIGYVEAHGTGTILGDPIEVSALTEAFREHTNRKGFCGIGSVKSNFGHLSCASGVAGLIKTVLVLENKAIPPTVHFTKPNPAIDFAGSPFYVTQELQPWKDGEGPRRAAVSSFGVGGTNAHLVLEEAPVSAKPSGLSSPQLIVLSARSEEALTAQSNALADHLEAHPEIDLADAAFTLQVGRRAFSRRRACVSRLGGREGLIEALRADPETGGEVGTERPVVFMFPGQGSQYSQMTAGLYRREATFRRVVDNCAERLEPHLRADLRDVLFPGRSGNGASAHASNGHATDSLTDTRWAQPALFTVEYALAELLRSWGIEPAATIGHSVGEFVAATLAGVMGLGDALELIARRGELISDLPRGSMLAVMAGAETANRFVGEEVSLAAVNAPTLSVLSGPVKAIDRVEAALASEAIHAKRLHTSHAFHSAMMDPILGEFRAVVAGVSLERPRLPFVETLNGDWADGPVTSPDYWSSQIRSPVRFADGLRSLGHERGPVGENPILLEVGPGRVLTTFASQTATADERTQLCVPTLPGPNDDRPDTEVLLGAVGQLWASGVAVDWGSMHVGQPRTRVSLPTYPFERRSYWVGMAPDEVAGPREPRDTTSWFHRPEWREADPVPLNEGVAAGLRVMVLEGDSGVGEGIAARLRSAGAVPIVVRSGGDYARPEDREFVVDPSRQDHLQRLVRDVCSDPNELTGVVDCWSAGLPGKTDLDEASQMTLLAPMRLAKHLSGNRTVRPLPMVLVARGTTRVDGGDVIDPPRALGVGVARVLPQEHPGLRVTHMDVDDGPAVPDLVVSELLAGAPEPAVAIRRGTRFLEAFEAEAVPLPQDTTGLPREPVVLVSGGLGHIGLALCEALFHQIGAKLVIISRSPLPPPDTWAAAAQDPNTPLARRGTLERLENMRSLRDEVIVVAADMNDPAAVQRAVEAPFERFGRLDMVVHGAGRVDAGAFASAADTGAEVVEAQFSPKLRGLFYLMDGLEGRDVERWILHGSISSVLGGLGLGAYAAANAVLDAVAVRGGDKWMSIAWDAWDNAAEAQSAGMPLAINPAEGADAFVRLLGADVGPRALVVVGDLQARLQSWVRHADEADAKSGPVERHPRPNLSSPYVEPGTDTERHLAEIWADQLGLESVGIHDRFLDLGGHSLLAVQVASEIRDRFQIELPVLKLFQAPTVSELAQVVEGAEAPDGAVDSDFALAESTAEGAGASDSGRSLPEAPAFEDDSPASLAKAGYRTFYDDVTRRLERSGVGDASFFLNYGYLTLGGEDEACHEVPPDVVNPSSIRLAFELIGDTDLKDLKVLDIGCGRGGTVALMAELLGANATGVDLSPEAIGFCRRTHEHPDVTFDVGDAENLHFEDGSFEAVTNIESSHTYPNLRAFLGEVSRVLSEGGLFLYTDLLPVQRWAEVRVLLGPLGLDVHVDRHITPNVLASCDDVAATRAQAFGEESAMIDNFLAVPGSPVYEQMASKAWEYRIVRATRR